MKTKGGGRIRVEITDFKDISSKSGNASLENQFHIAYHLALEQYPEIDIIRQSDGDVPALGARVFKIRGEFAFVEGSIRIYLRIKDPDGNIISPKVVKNNSFNVLLAIHDGVMRSVEEIKKSASLNEENEVKLALIPLSVEKDQDYMEGYIKEMVVSLTESFFVSDENFHVIPWKEAETYYFSDSSGERLINESPFDRIITFSVDPKTKYDYVTVGLASKENNTTAQLFEYSLYGDDEELDIIKADLAAVLHEITDQQGNWQLEKIQVASNDFSDYLIKGNEYHENNNLALSSLMYLKSLRLNPKQAITHLKLGVNYHKQAVLFLEQGNLALSDAYATMAESEYYQTLKFDSTLVQPYVELGRIMRYYGDYQTSKFYFEKAYQIDPDYNLLELDLAEACYWNGEYQKAIELLKPLMSNTNGFPEKQTIRLKYYLSLAYAGLKNYDDAILLMKVLTRQYPDYESYRYSLSNFYTELGIMAHNKNEFKKAIEFLNQSREYYQQGIVTIEYLVKSYLKLKQYSEAENVIDGASEFLPSYYYYDHANTIVEIWLGEEIGKNELYKQALKYAEKYTELVPNYPQGHSLLGMIYYNAGKESKGIESMEKGWELDSMDFWAGANLMEVYVVEAHYEKAISLYNHLKTLNSEKSQYLDQEVMIRFLALLAKCSIEIDSTEEQDYIDQFVKNKRKVSSWYYNLLDEWVAGLNLSRDRMNVINTYMKTMKEITADERLPK